MPEHYEMTITIIGDGSVGYQAIATEIQPMPYPSYPVGRGREPLAAVMALLENIQKDEHDERRFLCPQTEE